MQGDKQRNRPDLAQGSKQISSDGMAWEIPISKPQAAQKKSLIIPGKLQVSWSSTFVHHGCFKWIWRFQLYFHYGVFLIILWLQANVFYSLRHNAIHEFSCIMHILVGAYSVFMKIWWHILYFQQQVLNFWFLMFSFIYVTYMYYSVM